MSELENEPGCHNCVHFDTSIADEPCRKCLAAVPTKGWNSEWQGYADAKKIMEAHICKT